MASTACRDVQSNLEYVLKACSTIVGYTAGLHEKFAPPKFLFFSHECQFPPDLL